MTAQQPARPDVDMAAIRARAEHTPAGLSFVRRSEVLALCDAFDEARVKLEEIRALCDWTRARPLGSVTAGEIRAILDRDSGGPK